MRYHIRKEVTKVGRKTEVQWAVVDDADDRVVVRYANEEDAIALLHRYQLAKESGSENP